jgi:opacity protein-like surface antigen
MKTSLRIVSIVALGVLFASAAQAADPRVTVGGTIGWTLSDGVTSNGILAGDGNLYNSIGPKDSVSYGLNIGFFVSPNVEVGFLWDRQNSKLEVGGTNTVEVSDLKVDNYHGYVAYNFGESDASVRPYVLGGLGATRYSDISFSAAGQTRQIPGQSKFSTTWGAGVKVFPGRSFGLNLGARWTPTYIKSDATGWWCDPWYGCYVTGNAQYANQFELSGGITLRF